MAELIKSKSKVMDILADETAGKGYKAHKYSLDSAERLSLTMMKRKLSNGK